MKRSAQVALLLMGVGTVGAGAYAITPPRNNCVPQNSAPSAVAPNPAGAPLADPCPPRRQSAGIGRSSHYGSYGSWSGNSGTSSSSSGAVIGRAGRMGSSSTGGAVARGGFGGTGHGISSGG